MGALGSGTSTSYPVTLDTLLYVSGGGRSDYTNGPNPIADSQSRVDAEFMNDVIDAIIAIQTELGTSPSGIYDTVSERFNTIGGGGGGFPGASTDNAIVRWNGSTGTSLQDSDVIITDTNNMAGVVDLTLTRNLLIGGTAAGTLLDNGIVIALGVGPSTSPVNAVQLWAADRAGSPGKTGLHIRAEDGTSHVFSDRVGIGTVAPAEALEVIGGIKLGTTALLANGTIRFTGADIEGRINDSWVSMTAGSAGGTTSGIWKWSTQTVTPPPAQSIAVNNSVYDFATELYITEVNFNTIDSSILLDDLNIGDTIYIQDSADSSKSIRYTVSGTIVDVGTYRSVPVTFVSTGVANISNNSQIYVQFNLAGIHGSGTTNAVTIWSDQYTLSADAQLHYDPTLNNLGLKVTTFGTGAQGILALALGIAPTTSPTDTIQLWSADRGATGGKAGLHLLTEDGTTHVFSDYVGLNNLTPLTELDVVGKQHITRMATSSSNLWNILNVRVKGSTDLLSPNFGTYIGFVNENFSGTSFELARISGARGPADNSGILSFTVANAGAFTRTISIDKDANLIMNVASVGANLVQGIVLGSGVAATSSPADAIQMWSADRAAVAGKASLHLRTEDGTSHVFGDRVGIGTLTPTVALDVVGAINMSDPTTTRNNLGLGAASDVQFTRIGIGTAPTASAPLLFASGIMQKILLYGDAVGSRYGLGIAAAALQIFSAGVARIDLGSMSTVDGTTFTANVSIAGTSGNVGLGTSTFGTGATKVFALFNGVAPTTSPVDTIQMWSADRNAVAGKGSLHLRTEDGTSHVFGDMVGIGTTNPTAALDVVGALKVSDVTTTLANLGIGSASSSQFDRIGLGTAASANARLNFLAEVGQKILLYGDGVTVRNGLGIGSGVFQVFSQTSGTIDLGSMGVDGSTFTNRVSIAGSTGNVGLGTKTYGTSAVRNFALFAGTAPTTSVADQVALWVADVNAVAAKAGLHIRTEDGTSHVFGHLVGLGTIDPEAMLHTVSTGTAPTNNTLIDRYGDDVWGSHISVRKGRGTLALPTRSLVNDAVTSLIGYSWSRNAANTLDTWVQVAYINYVVDNVDAEGRIGGRLAFFTGAGVSAAPAERMRITSAGNVGIGATALPAGSLLTVGNLDVASGGLVLTSLRGAILNSHVLSGIEFWSNDTQLTLPGAVSAYIRAIATETHSATTLGSELVFAVTKNTTATPSVVMRLNNLSNVILFGAQAGTTLEKGIVIGSGIAPTTSPVDAVQIWAADRDGTALASSFHIRTETGYSYVFGDIVGMGMVDPIGTFDVLGTTSYWERHDAAGGGYLHVARKSRGTRDVPLKVIAGDINMYIGGQVYARNAADTADAWTYTTRIDSIVESADVSGRIGGAMLFYTTAPVSGTVTERMRINEDGLIGIAMTTPATRLHVQNSSLLSGGLILGSQRTTILLDNVISGVDFMSNDTNLTAPGIITAYIRAIADETHTATTLGTRMTFSTTSVGATVPTLRMTLESSGILNFGTATGAKIYLYEAVNSKYGLGIGSSQTQLFSPNSLTTRVEIGGMSTADGVTFVPVLRVLPGYLSMVLGPVGATATGTGGTYVFGISTGTRPTTSPAGMVQMWTEDHDATGILGIRSEANWITKIGNGIITRAAYVNLTTYTVAAPYVPVALEESNRTFLGGNATAMTQITLPAAGIAYTFKFIVTVVQGLRIRAAAGDTIRIGSTVTTAGGYVQSTAIGDYLELFAVSSAAWMARSPIQGWTVGV